MRSSELLTLAREVRRQVSNRFTLVAYPDHPYLLEPPELLIGGEGLLTAVFVPKADEMRRPALLQSRLIASRLALPIETRCVLLRPLSVKPQFEVANFAEATQNFDALIQSDNQTRRLGDMVQDGSIRFRYPENLERQRLLNATRSALALTLTGLGRRRTASMPSTSLAAVDAGAMADAVGRVAGQSLASATGALPADGRRRGSLLQTFRRGSQTLMSARSDRRGRALSLAVRASALDQFGLDNGVPYSRSAPLPMVFPDEDVTEFVSYEKLVRAASLVGLVIGPAGQPQLIESFLELEAIARQRRLRRTDLEFWLGHA
jgi:hypothetical protein